ncbi:hypothetical protein BCR42DRAFT_392690 [Absidia repens]|uniref:Uncharacterized protein n=1 Tax=Absidia repens TaxID=90262 RepID=A0A1X2IFR2_9FUNG|nr:hypothetical protein BCR42DRAFT_392690 [Absidia repens]
MATAGQSAFLQSDAPFNQQVPTPFSNVRHDTIRIKNDDSVENGALAAVLLCLTLLFDSQALFNQQVPTPFRILIGSFTVFDSDTCLPGVFTEQTPTSFESMPTFDAIHPHLPASSRMKIFLKLNLISLVLIKLLLV